MALSTLAPELRNEIVASLADSYDGRKAKIHGVRNLSATCRSFNSICGHIIFHTYHLDIRNSLMHPPWSCESYPTTDGIRQWCDWAIEARLAHLQTKSTFVREIYITDECDWGRITTNCAFPRSFIPELLDTLRMLGPITAVHLVTRGYFDGLNAMIDPDLWKWVVGVRPTMFSLEGHFEIPPGDLLQPIENLDTLSLHSCMNFANNTLIGLHKPRHFSLTYGQRESNRNAPDSQHMNFFTYKPTDGKLESINIDFCHSGTTTPLFDFSGVPQASIKISILHCGYPSVWNTFRPVLQLMFAEDLSGYNVQMKYPYASIMRFPDDGWKPHFQDHLREE